MHLEIKSDILSVQGTQLQPWQTALKWQFNLPASVFLVLPKNCEIVVSDEITVV